MVCIPYSGRILCCIILCCIVADGNSKEKHIYKHEAITVAAQRLGQIVEREQLFLKNSSAPHKPLGEQELTRRAQQLLSAYESYLEDNPRDVNGLILYGKFLGE